MRPSTRNAIFVALGIAILGAEIGAPGGDAKPPSTGGRRLAAIWPSSLSLLGARPRPLTLEASRAEQSNSRTRHRLISGPTIETAAMTAARRKSFTRRAQSHLLAELKDWSL